MHQDVNVAVAKEAVNQSTSGTMIIQGYHRTKDKNSPESIAYHGYNSSSRRNGSMYGDGFYMTRNMVDHLHSRYTVQYGTVIIKNEVNMKNVLICDLALSVKVYGKPVNLWQQFVNKGVKLSQEKAKFLKKHSILCEEADANAYHTSKSALALYDHNMVDPKIWAGLAYTGSQDGACLVIYATEQVFPRAWACYEPNKLYKEFQESNTNESIDSKYVSNSDADEDEDEDEDEEEDEEEDTGKGKGSNEYKHFVVKSLTWHTLNKREVDRIRAGFAPRFSRWIEAFSKLDPSKAQNRFNECLRQITSDRVSSFFNDVAHYAELSEKNFKYVEKLLDGVPDDVWRVFLTLESGYKNITCNDKFIIKFGHYPKSEFWQNITKYRIYNGILIKLYKIWAKSLSEHLKAVTEECVAGLKKITDETEFNNAVYYITKNCSNYSCNNYNNFHNALYLVRDQKTKGSHIDRSTYNKLSSQYQNMDGPTGHKELSIFILQLLAMPEVNKNPQILALVVPLLRHYSDTGIAYVPAKPAVKKKTVDSLEILDMEPDVKEVVSEEQRKALQDSYSTSLVDVKKRGGKAVPSSSLHDDDVDDDDDDN